MPGYHKLLMGQEAHTTRLLAIAERAVHYLYFRISHNNSALCRHISVGLLPGLHLVAVLDQKVDIVETILQTMLLVSVDFEMFAMTRSKVRDGLVGKVYLNLRLMVSIDGVEKFLEEALADNNGEHKVVELVVLMNVSKEGADNDSEAIAGDGPCGMLTGRAGAEVLTSHKDDSILEVGVIEDKVLLLTTVGVEAPVVEEIRTEAVLLCEFQITGGDNLVGVHIL